MLTITIAPGILTFGIMLLILIFVVGVQKNIYLKINKWYNNHKDNYYLFFGRIIFWSGFIWLFYINSATFLNTPKISGWQDIKQIFLTTQNIRFLLILAIYVVATLSYFLFILPFLNLEQLKIFGVEYKVATKQEIIAEKAYDARNELELFRVSFLQGIVDLDPLDPQGVLQYVGPKGQLKVWELAQSLASSLKDSYKAKFESQVSVFIANVKNGVLEEDSLKILRPEVQYAIRNSWETGNMFPIDGTQDAESYNYSVKAVPLRLDDDSTYSILCLHSFVQKFWEIDVFMISNAWKSLLNQAVIASLAPKVETISS